MAPTWAVPQRPLVTATTPFCKAGHSAKQFSCLHPLTAKEAAKNWSYPGVSWQRACRNLATTAALRPALAHTAPALGAPALPLQPCQVCCSATPHGNQQSLFTKELLRSNLPLICIWDLSQSLLVQVSCVRTCPLL